ncbi:MAG: pimeloyl-ACP methyl ester esterase BioH [Sulfuriflexus sp.]|nr:pimeloyl-ACP methyl ester esterase BioH [Sulfuriflexus sp.]
MTMLHSVVYGEDETSKPELVLLHGWGAHSGVWQTVLPILQKDFRVTCIDLPGHGNSPALADNGIDSWAKAVLEVAPEKSTWLGWSLGGLIGQRAASMEEARFERLILLSSTPKFVASEGWPEAVDEKTFQEFYAEVIREPSVSLLRFIAIQTRGSKTASEDSRVLRKTLLNPAPKPEALDVGMKLLLATDLREELNEISCPVLVLGGERDSLVPKKALSVISKLFVNAKYNVIKRAGHAPFLSHPNEFSQVLTNFCFRSNAEKHKEAK